MKTRIVFYNGPFQSLRLRMVVSLELNMVNEIWTAVGFELDTFGVIIDCAISCTATYNSQTLVIWPGTVATCFKPSSGLFGLKQASVLVRVAPDHIMATGHSRSGLRMIVPNSSFTRSPNKPEIRCQTSHLPSWNARSRDRAPMLTKFFTIALNRWICAYFELVVISVSVICTEF